MAVDGYLNFDTKINTKGFSGGVRKLGSGLDALKTQLAGIAKAAAAAFSVRAVVQLGRSAVEAAAAVNAANSALTQTFGALEQAARSAFSRVADASGILETRLHGVGTQIYAFAKAAGMDSVTALSMMEDALQVAADSAAYYDRSLEDVSESLTSFLKGNYANDAALGVSATETTRNTAAMRLYGKAFRDLTEAQKQLTLLQMVKDANALSGAEGQAAREAQGWENVIGNLKEAWRQLLAVVGQPVLHVAISAVQQLTALISAAQQAFGALSAVLGWEADQTAATAQTAQNISAAADAQNALTDAAKQTAKAQKDLTGFDELHRLSKQDSTAADTQAAAVPAAVVPALDTGETERAANALTERLSRLLEPVRIAWDMKGPELISEAERTAEKLRALFSGIGQSLEGVWTNGSGQRFVGNLLIGFTDLLGIVGDFSGALADAWQDNGAGTAYVQSVFDRWNTLLELIHAVTDAARTAWNGGSGKVILGDILGILTDINNTWANLREQFTAAWTENGRGVKLFERIFSIVQKITGTVRRMSSATAEWAKSLDFSPALAALDGLLAALDPLIDTIGGALADVYESVLLPLGKWTIEEAAPAAIELLTGVIRVLTSIINALKPAAKWLWENFLQPIAQWTGGAIVAVLGVLTQTLNNIADWISRHSGIVTKFFKRIGAAALQAVAPFTALGAAIIENWDEIKDTAQKLWDSVTGFFSLAWTTIKAVWQNVGKWFSDRWQDIKNVFSIVGTWFSDRFREAWSSITGIFSAIGGWFSDRWQDIKNVFAAVGSFFSTAFTGGWDAVKAAFSGVKKWFSGIWDDIKGVFSNISSWFSEKFQAAYDAITGIFDKLGGYFDGIWGGVKNVLNAVLSGIESMLNGIVRAANKVIGFLNSFHVSIPDWVPSIGGKSIGFDFSEIREVSLPRLATGTVIPANYGEFAAILGDNKREPEIVSPVGAMKQAFLEALSEQTPSGDQTIVVQLMCDGRKLAEVVRKYNLSGARQTNGGKR